MSEEARLCSREGCTKKLRSNNTTGVCTPCKKGKPSASRPAKPKVQSSDTAQRFAIVTEALGMDPVEQTTKLQAEWLANLKSHVQLDG
jgi:hypothetical protein